MLRKFLVGTSSLFFAGVAPALATSILLTGAGVFIGSGPLTPPTITPQPSAAFDVNSALGYSNNAFSFTATGPTELPATPTHSFFVTVEGQTDAMLNTFNGYEYLLGSGAVQAPLSLTSDAYGSPLFQSVNKYDGTGFLWGYWAPGVNVAVTTGVPSATQASNINSGLYTWTGVGGGCARSPSGYYAQYPGAATAAVVTADPGFGCATTPAIVPASTPGLGYQQVLSTGATSCVSNSPVAGEMTVTTAVSVAHGVYPGGSFALSGFSGGGNTGYNATYTALIGTTGTTLVGATATGGGTCPANSPDTSGGLALSGSGGSVTVPSIANDVPGATLTGINTKANARFSCILGEYGDDSLTPGVQFLRCLNGDTGADLYGSPAVTTILNQGTSNFTGWVNGIGANSSNSAAPVQDTTFPVTASISTAGVLNVTANTFAATISISGTTATVTGTPTGIVAVGQTLSGGTVSGGTTITGYGTGTDGAGTYTVNNSQSATATTLAGVISVGETITGPSLPKTTIASLGSGTGVDHQLKSGNSRLRGNDAHRPARTFMIWSFGLGSEWRRSQLDSTRLSTHAFHDRVGVPTQGHSPSAPAPGIRLTADTSRLSHQALPRSPDTNIRGTNATRPSALVSSMVGYANF